MSDEQPDAPPPAPPPDRKLTWGELFALLARRATGAILVVNVAVFVAISVAGNSLEATNETRWLIGMGAKHNGSIAAGEVWRLVSSCFMHIGLLHIFVNMWSLINIGLLIEALLGTPLFLATYVFSGLCGSLASYYFSKALAAGASGAIFGLCGSLMTLGVLAPSRLPPPLRQQVGRWIVTFILLNGMIGIEGAKELDHWAHGGGLLGGILFTALLVLLLRWPDLFQNVARVFGVAAIAVLVVGCGAALRHVPEGLGFVEVSAVQKAVFKDVAEHDRAINQIVDVAKRMSAFVTTGELSAADANSLRDAGLTLIRVRRAQRERLAALTGPLRNPENARFVEAVRPLFAEVPGLEKRLTAARGADLPKVMFREIADHEADWVKLMASDHVKHAKTWSDTFTRRYHLK